MNKSILSVEGRAFGNLSSTFNILIAEDWEIRCMHICDVKLDPTDTGKCYHCCSTDLCNNVGCGEQDHRGLNGSMCYECDGKLQSEACHQVTFCDYDENPKEHHFFFLFTEGYSMKYATAKALLTTHNGGLYTAYTFGNSMNESWNLQPNQNEFALNHNVYMFDGIKHAGVKLQGNKQISVFGLSYNNYSGNGHSGGYLAIPTNYLSRRYIIPSYKVYQQRPLSSSMIALTPLESSTTVNIHLKTTSGSLTSKTDNILPVIISLLS
ncbi:unnamed protein product [Mytilus edulis]|uniref:Uncharacterized protein n=1 Tax=Mytilus edulis TaxID=6550 RepID=A0A8S3V210_MYTED|nr:unnamed protein product [Mytilus edulis]